MVKETGSLAEGGKGWEVVSPLTPLLPSPASPDPFIRGSDYLRAVRQLAVEPGMIDVTEDIDLRIRICTWIGNNIDAINAELQTCLEACHSCFHPQERREMQILAAPLAEGLGVDAFCNITAEPSALIIDVGRIYPQDWLSIVAHEYAHAHLGHPGHERDFLAVLVHLCLGLGLEPPQVEKFNQSERSDWLRNWPHCTPRPHSLAFWCGQT